MISKSSSRKSPNNPMQRTASKQAFARFFMAADRERSATQTNGDIVSYPARTVFAFACYLLPLGLILLLVPNLLLSLFQIPPTSEVWIRVVGMLVIFLGVYYFVSARAELRLFMIWSVLLRASVFIFFGAFVLVGLAPPVLLLFGAVDLAAALWTWSAFRKEHSIRQRLVV